MTTDVRDAPAPSPSPLPPPPPPLPRAAATFARVLAGLVLVGAGVAWAVTAWYLSAVEVDETTSTHAATGRVELDLDTNGDVEIRVHDADDIVVETRTEWLWREPEVEVTERDDAWRLSTERCHRWWAPLDRCGASFVVRVPADTAVTGTIAHGAIVVAGLAAPLDVETGHGRVEVRDVDDAVTVRTGHGRVVADRIGGPLTAVTGHGRVTLVDALDGADVRTGHGRVEVVRGLGPLAVATDHGRVEVTDSASLEASIETGHGTVTYTAAVEPRTVGVVTGHGGVEVVVPAEDEVAYQVRTRTGHGRELVTVPRTPDGVAGSHRIDVRTGHGAIEVRPGIR